MELMGINQNRTKEFQVFFFPVYKPRYNTTNAIFHKTQCKR